MSEDSAYKENIMEDNSWSKARRFKILGYRIPVLRAESDSPRKFYTELRGKNYQYLGSMGSDMPFYWLAAIETYIKRGKLL